MNKEDGKYMNCLRKNMDNANMKAVLIDLEQFPGISSQIVAGAVTISFKDNDYNNGLVRLFIAYRFFYEMKVNLIHKFNKNTKK